MHRDKAILSSLEQFRVLTREQIQQLHFSDVKHPVTQVNQVLKRMHRDGQIDVSRETRMYRYFPVPSIKKNSAKIPHFLAIAAFYLSLPDRPTFFDVEPKFGGKGTIEPDAFMIWRRAPFFVEIQRNPYSQKVMDAKMKRYADYFHSDAWRTLPWQPAEKKVFPRLWMITDIPYALDMPFKVIQTRNAEEFLITLK